MKGVEAVKKGLREASGMTVVAKDWGDACIVYLESCFESDQVMAEL